MAKVSGIIKIEGTVEDMNFYKQNGKNFVRRKGGISGDRIRTEPNFIRTRENNNEFSHSCLAAKELRTAMGTLVHRAKDGKLSNRLMQVMSRVKNMDMTSNRGLRNVSVGFNTPGAKQLLKGFDCNINAPLKNVLYAPYDLNTSTGTVLITDFLPAEQVLFPEGATHVSFQSAVLGMDFSTGDSELAFSSVLNITLDYTANTVELTPTSVPAGNVQLFLLSITFFQEVNGIQYSLRNEEYNVLHVLDVL